jgi:phage major head subunit gpT-like protein
MEYITKRDVIGRYYLALNQDTGAAWIPQISNKFDSDQASERYAWLNQSPMMREWVAGRNAQGFKETSMLVENTHFEATIDILKRHLRRDKTAQLDVRIAELAQRANSHWAYLLSTLIAAGASTACYDGQYFFDTDHSEGDSGSQSNDIEVDISALPVATSGTTTAPSVEEMQFSIMKAIQQIVSIVDDRGQPMNADARKFLVYVPVSFWLTALNAVATPNQVAASQTALQGARQQGFSIDVAVDPRSSWTTNFAVFRTDSAIKPLIRQAETEPAIAMKWLDSEYCFDNDAVQVGVDAWRNVAYGFWQNACLVTLA